MNGDVNTDSEICGPDQDAARKRLLKSLIDWHQTEHQGSSMGYPILDLGMHEYKTNPFKLGRMPRARAQRSIATFKSRLSGMKGNPMHMYDIGKATKTWHPGGGVYYGDEYYPGGGWEREKKGRGYTEWDHTHVSTGGVGMDPALQYLVDEVKAIPTTRNPLEKNWNLWNQGRQIMEASATGSPVTPEGYKPNPFAGVGRSTWRWHPGGGVYYGTEYQPGGGAYLTARGNWRHTTRPGYASVPVGHYPDNTTQNDYDFGDEDIDNVEGDGDYDFAMGRRGSQMTPEQYRQQQQRLARAGRAKARRDKKRRIQRELQQVKNRITNVRQTIRRLEQELSGMGRREALLRREIPRHKQNLLALVRKHSKLQKSLRSTMSGTYPPPGQFDVGTYPSPGQFDVGTYPPPGQFDVGWMQFKRGALKKFGMNFLRKPGVMNRLKASFAKSRRRGSRGFKANLPFMVKRIAQKKMAAKIEAGAARGNQKCCMILRKLKALCDRGSRMATIALKDCAQAGALRKSSFKRRGGIFRRMARGRPTGPHATITAGELFNEGAAAMEQLSGF